MNCNPIRDILYSSYSLQKLNPSIHVVTVLFYCVREISSTLICFRLMNELSGRSNIVAVFVILLSSTKISCKFLIVPEAI